MNERITEDLVRSHFKQDPLFEVIRIEEQRSASRRITDLLAVASKSGSGNAGRPEFVITFPSQNSNYAILIECKPSSVNHESEHRDHPKEFAIDGVLHYAKILSKEYEVIAIAFSGQNLSTASVSTFVWRMGQTSYKETPDKQLLQINDYIKLFDNEYFVENLKSIDIIQKAVFLNEELHSYSITENGRCTIVSALLLGLLDRTFKQGYATYESSSDLADGLMAALKRVLKKNKIRNRESMLGEFQKLINEPLFKHTKIKRKQITRDTIEVAKEFVDFLKLNVFPLIQMDDAGIDILGRFYTEFIRYAGSSQKQGLVLTPAHVADLFCDLGGITEDSIVYDPCCGSGGFLIGAMKRMLGIAGNNGSKRTSIKTEQLVGVERRPDMFTYACTNMMFRGDGKSNIYNEDCFNSEANIIQSHAPNVVFLNPPYDVGNAGQMQFVEHALKVATPSNGIVVAIVQMSCALKKEKDLIAIKKRLIAKHRLRAVISMPDKLFDPIGVITCTMVWEANKSTKGFKTWFGYLKDDGFQSRKRHGRIDAKKRWATIRKTFLEAYNNLSEVPGLSVRQEVDETKEWCAEAYLLTDYSTLNEKNFLHVIKRYVLFKKLNEIQ